MPKKLERKLERQAQKKGLKGKSKDAYVYGTLRETGWKPSRERHNPAIGLEMHDKSGHADVERLIKEL